MTQSWPWYVWGSFLLNFTFVVNFIWHERKKRKGKPDHTSNTNNELVLRLYKAKIIHWDTVSQCVEIFYPDGRYMCQLGGGISRLSGSEPFRVGEQVIALLANGPGIEEEFKMIKGQFPLNQAEFDELFHVHNVMSP